MDDQLKQLVNIWLRVGVNIQENQFLHVTLPSECSCLKEIISKQAKILKVKEVVFQDVDSYEVLVSQYRDSLATYDTYLKEQFAYKNELLSHNCAYLEIRRAIDFFDEAYKTDISALKEIEKKYIAEFRKNKRNIRNIVSCKTVIPTEYWAKQIFGNTESALKKLWDIYFSITLSNQKDAVEIWKLRVNEIQKKVRYLNGAQFKSLFFEAEKTRLHVELIDHHVWVGGCEETDAGIRYMPNFPTQEIFTAPKKLGINGIFANTKPLCYEGRMIEHFQITFQNGKIISCQANENEFLLQEMITSDENSCFCGEIAILPGKTEISKENVVFKTTLLDENAACHLALGCAYPCNLDQKINYSEEDFAKHEMNFSKIHVDMMFGDDTIHITAVSKDNEKVQLMKAGKWVI